MSDSPYIAGFDMPGAASSDPEEIGVLVALLNCSPGARWREIFNSQADAFVAEQRITQVRLIGAHIHLVGNVARLRLLASQVQELVTSVTHEALASRLRVERRVAARAPASGARQAAQIDVRAAEVAAVASVPGIQDMLARVCALTGMRFSAVARVTENRWTTCAVEDGLDFGLLPGQDLILETTICRELQPGRSTIFGQASAHPVYSAHPAPRIYGFESHMSIPLVLQDGSLFGSLCALDPKPAALTEETVAQVQAIAAELAAQLKLASH